MVFTPLEQAFAGGADPPLRRFFFWIKVRVMATMNEQRGEKRTGAAGFTLLEVVLVIAVLGLIAAMTLPFVGKLSDAERTRQTRETMELIRRALLGDPDRFDEAGKRIIGGYIGHFGDWPDLWEEKPELRETTTGDPPFDLDDPDNWARYHYRPSGSFGKNGWSWHFPNRKLTNDILHNQDHIGGLETENEGQPRGLWTIDPSGDGSETLNQDIWRGPYMMPPHDAKPQDGEHWATTDQEYQALNPRRTGTGEQWEDGDYSPVDGDPGEYFDDKEAFRLLQTDGRLADGWGRALRFFLTEDTAHPGETIFWVLSEGPDRQGTYPTKGTFNGSIWNIDPSDTMATTYDENDRYNLDNIIMKISSLEWRPLIDEREAQKRAATEKTLARLRHALVGASTVAEGGINNGFSGSLCRLPRLFRWEGDTWDNRDAADIPYTKGQPRGLWTRQPNSTDPGDDIDPPDTSSRGIGWRGPYLPAPYGIEEEELLLDGWGRELLFFHDRANEALLILSRGSDGRFDFLDGDTYEPASPTEEVDVSTYDPADAGGFNGDNVTLLLREEEWRGALLTLHLRIYNALPGITKAVFYRGWDFSGVVPLAEAPIFPAAGDLTDEDGDGSLDDWYRPNAFVYDETTTDPAVAGTRLLLVWQDADGNNEPDSGEQGILLPFDLGVHNDPGNDLRTVTLDADDHFSPLP